MLAPHPDHWTLISFWREPWQKADVIAAWGAGLGLGAIVTALSLAVAEHRRASRIEERRRAEFLSTVLRILDGLIANADEAMASTDYKWINTRLRFDFGAQATDAHTSLATLLKAAPADGELVLALAKATRAAFIPEAAWTQQPAQGVVQSHLLTMREARLELAAL